MKNSKLEKLFKQDENEELAAAAWQLDRDMQRMLTQCESVIHIAKRVKDQVRKADFNENLEGKFYTGINSIGELQILATQFDIQCALLNRSVDELNSRIRASKKAPVKKLEDIKLKQIKSKLFGIAYDDMTTAEKQIWAIVGGGK